MGDSTLDDDERTMRDWVDAVTERDEWNACIPQWITALLARLEVARSELRTLRAENERLAHELDRHTHCHVCGDCLDILDGRCELHANVEDETDYWHQGGERFECECSWCKANEALNAKEPDHA
jgi:hypothetical protein